MAARRLILAVGAIVLIAGLFGLLMPVSVSDGNGGSIGCGNAVAADMSGAQSANDKTVANIPIVSQFVPHTDYVAQCDSALSTRRDWSIPVTVLGALVVVAGVVVNGRRADGKKALQI
jgi:hypothetical protein